MKIKLKVHLSGARNGKAWPPRGSVIEVPDAEGADMCAGGLATPVADTDGDVETAIMDAAEQRADDGTDGGGPVTTETGPRRVRGKS